MYSRGTLIVCLSVCLSTTKDFVAPDSCLAFNLLDECNRSTKMDAFYAAFSISAASYEERAEQHFKRAPEGQPGAARSRRAKLGFRDEGGTKPESNGIRHDSESSRFIGAVRELQVSLHVIVGGNVILTS